jgi:hypothetical protein
MWFGAWFGHGFLYECCGFFLDFKYIIVTAYVVILEYMHPLGVHAHTDMH